MLSLPFRDVFAANDYHALGESATEHPDTIATVVGKALQQVLVSASVPFPVTCVAGS